MTTIPDNNAWTLDLDGRAATHACGLRLEFHQDSRQPDEWVGAVASRPAAMPAGAPDIRLLEIEGNLAFLKAMFGSERPLNRA